MAEKGSEKAKIESKLAFSSRFSATFGSRRAFSGLFSASVQAKLAETMPEKARAELDPVSCPLFSLTSLPGSSIGDPRCFIVIVLRLLKLVFVAASKDKTLELPGVEQPGDSFKPNRVYSMRQAIQEGLIFYLLAHYVIYKEALARTWRASAQWATASLRVEALTTAWSVFQMSFRQQGRHEVC